MRVLIDTNIFIRRENHVVIPENLQALLNLLSQAQAQIVLHPFSLKDIERDTNPERKSVVLSKIKTYAMIEQPPLVEQDDYFSKLIGVPTSENELVDDNLLYCVFRDSVDYLITEDKDILAKSRRVGLSHRTLTIEDALAYIRKRLKTPSVTSPPALREVPVYNLNLNDPIFDSLRIEYAHTRVPFPDWWSKISRQGRKAWVFLREDGMIGAVLIYKIEDEGVFSEPPLPPKKRVKISTLKVASSQMGQKLGELFIKISIDFALKNDAYEIFLTHFTKPNDELVELITEYGFFKTSTIDGEDVYLKKLTPDAWSSPSDVSKRFYPSFYDGKLVNKFIVPILPIYHDRLFTDYRHRQPTILEYSGQFIVEGNTIKKAYLSHSKVLGMRAGDILLFYRSEDEQSIVSLGVVEAVHHSADPKRIAELVAKRTVYQFEEIQRFARKATKVILFRAHFHMRNPLELNYLKNNRILSQAPQSIVRISHAKYEQLKIDGEIDGRLTVG